MNAGVDPAVLPQRGCGRFNRGVRKPDDPAVPPKGAGAPGAVWGEVPRLALTVSEAAEALGVSDFLREHIAPELRWVRRGRRNLVSMRELEAWLEREAKRTLE
jgi:excisionase family DNA binding protein